MARVNEFQAVGSLAPIGRYVSREGELSCLGRGEYFCRAGEVCRLIGVVKSGYFKHVVIDSQGDERVTGFVFAGEVVTDYVNSFLTSSPSFTSIVAGCRAEIVCMPIGDVRRHMASVAPELLAESAVPLLREAYRRYLDLHTKSPAERYRDLAIRCPREVASVAFQELASFLGISRRQLHRIREEM